MKQTITTLILLLMFCGCKKEKDETKPTQSWSFEATVDGTTFTADSAIGALHIEYSLGFPQRTFVLVGYCKNLTITPNFGDTINSTAPNILFYDTIAIDGSAMLFIDDWNQPNNEFNSTSASFRVTSVDTINKKISGNFNGIVQGDPGGGTKVVTNGKFTNVSYEIF